MMHMIMLVLDDPDRLDEVLEAWRSAGVSGITIMETVGAYRRETRRVTGRYLFGLPGLTESVERSQYTLFAIVPDSRTSDLCLEASERIIGDLNEPNTGVFAAWELSSAKGVRGQDAESGGES
jgi:hypothetical protein